MRHVAFRSLAAIVCLSVGILGGAQERTLELTGDGVIIHERTELVAGPSATDYPVIGSDELSLVASARCSLSPTQVVQSQRTLLIQHLQTLQDAYCKAGQLDEAVATQQMIRELQAQTEIASQLAEPIVGSPASTPEEPQFLYDLRGQNGLVVYRKVTGSTSQTIWGGENNEYTDDSSLNAAAVHAGLVEPGHTVWVRATIIPGAESYPAISRHGIQSDRWGDYGGGYRLDAAGQEMSNPYHLRGQDIPPLTVYVQGSLNGYVWGNGPYTDDSDIATAAVHAGLLKAGESGFVMVTLEGGKSEYSSSEQNGVTTRSYASWEGSYRLTPYLAERR